MEVGPNEPAHAWVPRPGTGGAVGPLAANLGALADPSSTNPGYSLLAASVCEHLRSYVSPYITSDTTVSLDGRDVWAAHQLQSGVSKSYGAAYSVIVFIFALPEGASDKRWLESTQSWLIARPATPRAPYSPWLDRLKEIESLMDLTRSQLAQALMVERATLYHWFRGTQPRAKSLARIDDLTQIAEAWHKAGLGSARGAWYLRAMDRQHPLGTLLSAEPLDRPVLLDLIRMIAEEPGRVENAPPTGIDGFPIEDQMQARRRVYDLFPATFPERD